MIRMLLTGYIPGIRPERGPCDEVHLNLAYLIDTDNAIIVDVEVARAIRQAETGAAKTMVGRAMDRFGLWPERLIADGAYGSAPMPGRLVHERAIEPHIPVFDKSARKDGTLERSAFSCDHEKDVYTCPEGKTLRQRQKQYKKPVRMVDANGMMRYRAKEADCDACPLRQKCIPTEPRRKILRSVHEGARDMARDIAQTEDYEIPARLRKKVEMLFAPLKRLIGVRRLRLRGPKGAKDAFHLAAAAQNLRKLAKLLPDGSRSSPA